jgi:hypothetical protein
MVPFLISLITNRIRPSWYVTSYKLERLHLAKSGVKNQIGLAQLCADIGSFFHPIPRHEQRDSEIILPDKTFR